MLIMLCPSTRTRTDIDQRKLAIYIVESQIANNIIGTNLTNKCYSRSYICVIGTKQLINIF